MEEQSQQPQIFVFWIMWFAILCGIFIIQFAIGGGIPTGSDSGDAPSLPLILAIVPAIASFAIRFILIPKASELVKLLPLMIIGLALAESVGLLGLFLMPAEFPHTKLVLFATSVFCILVYAPVYASAVIKREEVR